ncbi:MAG: hypothetical protein EBX52_06560 [Proteobacteria bacterium]|nr:hypothetical protein [Pseudomonadota bacterium]
MIANHKKKALQRKPAGRPSRAEEILLRQVGLLIHKTLFDLGKPVEWLSFKSGVARSTIREIIAGRSNSRIATINILARSLGFSDLVDFLNEIKKNQNT